MKKKITSLILIFCFIIGNLTITQAKTTKSQILEYDQTVLTEDCIEAGIDGDYVAEIQDSLTRINEIRKEACDKGVPNPNNPDTKLKPSDYVPIQWSSDLEYIARIRAAEASIVTAHMRTNGKSCFDIESPNKIFSSSEVLAWNTSKKMVQGINQWYGEKEDWIRQNANAVTGHYTSMINPENIYVGLGTFCSTNAAWFNTTCGRFSSSASLDSSHMPKAKNVIQKLHIHKDFLTKAVIQEEEKLSGGSAKTTVGDQYLYALRIGTSYLGSKGSVLLLDTVSWTSSNPSVASVDKNGVVSLKSAGTVTLTASGSGYTASKTLKVEKSDSSTVSAERIKAGTQFKDTKSKGYYKITSIKSSNRTVTYVKPQNKKQKSIAIPETVTYKGKTFKVTAIKDSACYKNTKLTSVTIGANVKTIGNKAFYGCEKLKTIRINTTKLTRKSLGSKLFSGIQKRAKITVPKKSLKNYKTILKKKGQKKTVKIVSI